MGIVPTLSATTIERTSESEDPAPVLISTTPHSSSPSPKPYIPADHLPIDEQTESDSHWAAAASGVNSDAVAAHSSSECFCSGSASDTGSPGSVPSQSSFSTLFSGDLLDPFIVYPNYNNTSVSADHSHSPNDPAVPSPISVVDDPTSFTTQGVEAQHPFHASGESVYYAPSSAQQVQDVISKEHVHFQRQRYAQDHIMPSFSGPIHNFKQPNLNEEQQHCKSQSPRFLLPIRFVLKRVPDSLGCQMSLIRHLLTVEVVSEPLVHIKYMEVQDVHYGKVTSAVSFTSHSLMLSTVIIMGEIVRLGYRPVHTPLTHLFLGEKSSRVSGSVHPSHHWPTVPLENDTFDALPKFGTQ